MSYVQSEIERLQTYRRTRLAMGDTAWADELLPKLTELQARRAEEVVAMAKDYEHYLAASAKVFPQRQVAASIDLDPGKCVRCGRIKSGWRCETCEQTDQDFIC